MCTKFYTYSIAMKSKIKVFSIIICFMFSLVLIDMKAYASDTTDYDIVTNTTAVATGNCMVKLTWDYSNANIAIENFQYLIYRSESEDGEFVKIGYTQKGVQEYIDAGGDSSLTAGKTYYYKVQAYSSTDNASSNLYYAEIASATPVAQTQAENEFVLETEKSDALTYIREKLAESEKEIEVDIWLDSGSISGYPSKLFEEAESGASSVTWTGYDITLTDNRIIRNGLNNYTIVYTPVYLSEYDRVTNVKAVAAGDCMVKLTWSYSNSDVSASEFQYLIYRSESLDEEFVKIGYTQKGVMEYIDAGGTTALTAGKTYYYKIQAYAPTQNVSSNLYYTEAVSVTPVAQTQAENEFVLEDEKNQAITYLKDKLINRESEIEINIWIDADLFSGYSKVLFDAAILESEDVNEYNAGDYLYFHLTGYDCTYTDNRIIKNGLNYYTLVYKPTYYSTNAEEEELEEIVDDIIEEFNFTQETSDFEKVKKVYEYLSEDASYDLSLKSNGLSRCSAYDAIVQKKAVCQGYSNAAFYILKKLGINNRIITGDVYYDEEWRVHAWNLVEIDGKWYNVCITTEVHMREDYNVLSYRYLLKPDDDKYFEIFRRDEIFSNTDFVSSHPMTEMACQVAVEDSTITAPVLTLVPKSGVTMSLSWTKVSGASYYEIFRSDSAEGEYIKVKTTTSLSASDTGLSAGKRYYYKIRAVKSVDNVTKYGTISDAKASVALATPTITSAVMTESGALITWTKASGADRYNIYRKDSTSGSYEYVASVVGDLQYEDTDVEAGKTYYYKVRPYKKYDGVVYYSKYSSAMKIEIGKVSSLKATPKSGVTMKLSWGSVANATSYDIYYKTQTDENYTQVKTTTGTSTSHTGLSASQLYTYKVVAKNSTGIIAVSDTVLSVTLATPTVTKIENSVDGVYLSWTKASGADRYNIYRSTSINGEYEYIASVQNVLEYTDTTVVSGTTYYYKVRAYKRYDGVVYYGEYSSAFNVTYISAPVLSVTPKSGVTMSLSWTSASPAGYYDIYYGTSVDGDYIYLKTTTGSSTSHTNLTAGTLYYYKIRSYQIINGVKVYSAYSDVAKAVTLARPTIESVNTTDEGTTISWSKASGADRYNIYRSTSPNGTYEYIDSVQHVTSYMDTNNISGEYYYKVRAYKRVDGKVYYGQYSYSAK